jgi:CobQ-like glutamine amidotransferase family enzyme
MKLTIGWLYPDLMSTYGDRGNIICLKKRCEWRGINVEVKELSIENEVSDLEDCDLLFMGGAQDRQQKIASQDLRENKGPVLKKMIEKGIPGLFVCAAYQFLGHYYRPAEGEEIEGLHIFDLYTQHFGKDKPRCIGNIVIKNQNVKIKMQNDNETMRQWDNYFVGFENHGGRTYLGKGVEPLGKVVVGYGNNGEDKTEGCVYKNAIGSYLHGPILPKNPHLADYLIKMALSKKYGNEVKLKKLDDALEWQAHNFVLQKLNVKK